MAERNFVVLRYQDKVPAMASCAKCQRKFFTPATYSRDPVGAQECLVSKFDRHECEEKAKEDSLRAVNNGRKNFQSQALQKTGCASPWILGVHVYRTRCPHVPNRFVDDEQPTRLGFTSPLQGPTW